MRRTLGRSAFWLALFVWLAGAAAANADVMYDYSGNILTSNTGMPAGSISGDIVLANPLPASTETDNPVIKSFSFTDGVNTITNTTPNVVVGTAAGGASFFTTNSSGQITNYEITLLAAAPGQMAAPGGFVNQFMNINSFGDTSSYAQLTAGGACCVEGGGTNQTAGTWSGPISSLTPTFSLQFGTTPNGENPAFVALATAKDATGAITLGAAAKELNVDHFNWVQVIEVSPGLTACVGKTYPTGSAACDGLTNQAGKVPALGTTDPPTGGWRYQDPTFSQHGQNPFYWDETPTNPKAYYQGFQTAANIITNPALFSSTSLSDAFGYLFEDAPKFGSFPGTDTFVDVLVGVSGNCTTGSTCKMVPIDNTGFQWSDTNGMISMNATNGDPLDYFGPITPIDPLGGSDGNITVQPISLDQFLADTGYTLDSFEALASSPSPVPEPSTLAIFAIALLSFLFVFNSAQASDAEEQAKPSDTISVYGPITPLYPQGSGINGITVRPLSVEKFLSETGTALDGFTGAPLPTAGASTDKNTPR